MLKTLYLHDNKFRDKGAARLAAFLEKNMTLTSIDLSSNEIEDGEAAIMVAALEKNYAPEVCYLDCPDEMQEQVDQYRVRNIARRQQWHDSVMGWMWASKHLLVRLPQDVALMIGKMIWKTRTIYVNQ